VGPRSAGAVPGPACYGRGGELPTVTDADLVAGRIPDDIGFEALGELDKGAAAVALASLGLGGPEEAAAGVLDVVDAAMERAIRKVSVERGVDPAGLALVAFGGAGPLHACALAERLGMAAVVIPPRAGVLSAVGTLAAPVQHDVVRTWPTPSEHDGLPAALAELSREAVRGLVADAGGGESDVTVVTALDARYAGQSHELRVPSVGEFAFHHQRRNGYDRPDHPIEVVALRATARRAAPLDPTRLKAVKRPTMDGPAVVVEDDATIWVPPGWRGEPRAGGTLVLRREGAR
jgi:N-methylhydantoinase A